MFYVAKVQLLRLSSNFLMLKEFNLVIFFKCKITQQLGFVCFVKVHNIVD